MTNIGRRAALALATLATACSSPGAPVAPPVPVVIDARAVDGRPAADAAPVAKVDRPNIIVVVADDQRADALACMPKLRALLPDATEFRQHYAATPLCCPARTTLLTGRYAHNHGVQSNGDVEDETGARIEGLADFERNGNDPLNIAKAMRDVGYRTAYVGKYLNGYDVILRDQPRYVPPGWDDWHVMAASLYYDFQLVQQSRGQPARTTCYPSTETPATARSKRTCARADASVAADVNYSTHVLGELAAGIVRDAVAGDTPFMLWFAPKAPHMPATAPPALLDKRGPHGYAAAAVARLGPTCAAWAAVPPPSVREADVRDKPAWVQAQAKAHRTFDFADQRRRQLMSALPIEDEVERLLGALGEAASNTVVIYLADNGLAWGEHWHKLKNCMYDACGHVPLLINDPRTPGPRVIDEFTQDIDIAPTIAALSGVALPAGVDGLELVSRLRGDTSRPPRAEVFQESWALGTETDRVQASIRTARWRYIKQFVDASRDAVLIVNGRPQVELYDLAADPGELDNLLYTRPRDADVEAAVRELDAVLTSRLTEGVPTRPRAGR